MIDKKVLMALMIIDFVLPIVIMIAFIVAHNRIVKTNNARLFLRLGFVAILVGIVLTFFGAYTALSAAGPGAILCSETFVMGLVTAFILFDKRSLKKEREIADDKTRKYLIPLKLVLVFAQLLPAFGANTFYKACDSLYRQQAKILISAIEIYYEKNNALPDSLEVLVPEYVSEIPKPSCLQPYNLIGEFNGVGTGTNYSMLICGDKKLLAVSATILGFVVRYDFATQKWSSSDFLDGYCAYLD